MVGSAGPGTRADAGGQLLRELEALSAALYNVTAGGGGGVRERRTTSSSNSSSSSSSDTARRSLDDLVAMASKSHQSPRLTWLDPLDAKNSSNSNEAQQRSKKKGSSLWDWKPLRALAHIGQRRLNCSFSAHVHGVKQLPSSLEGLRLEVRLRHKDEERRTVPSLVFRGTADIEETIRLRCSVYVSLSSSSSVRYMSKTFVLSVVAPDAAELELGKHRLDLSRILPREHDGSGVPLCGSNSSWNTSFKLSGKAKGAVLTVTFGYEIESSTTAAGEVEAKLFCPPSPDSRLDQLRSSSSLPNSPELDESKDRTMTMVLPSQSQVAQFLASEYSIDIDQLNFEDDGEEEDEEKEQVSNGSSSALLAPGTPGRQDEFKELSLEQSSGGGAEQEEEGEFSVIEQGVEDNSSLKLWGGDEKGAGLDEEAEQDIGEFLHMLKPNTDSDEGGVSDSSPRGLLLKQFEQEQAMAMSGFGLSIDSSDQELGRPSHESSAGAGGVWCSSDEEQDLSAFVDAAESELQKATQLMKSKARAKMLEDAEAEALMQEWGLNEKAFQSSPPKSEWLGDASTALVVLPPTPCLAEGFGTTIATRDGGSLRSMNPVHFQGGRNEGRLVMHVSKSVVVPTEMGSDVLDIFRTLAAAGAENMAVQVMETMPLEDITGKTVQQIALEGQDAKSRYSLEAGKHKPAAVEYGYNGSGTLARTGTGDMSRTSSLSSPTKYATADDALMSLDELAPVAMEKIEALAMQGLKIQSDMPEEEAPYAVEPLFRENRKSRKMIGVGNGGTGVQLLESSAENGTSDDLMSMSISLDEWMRLDAGVLEAAETDDNTRAVMAAHNAAHTTDIVLMATNGEDEEQDKAAKQQRRGGLMGDTVTLAMLVQLRDPLRNYEPVGAPMMALVQAERVMLPPQKPRMWKRVSVQGNGEKDEEEEQEVKPQFKITGVHLAGLKPGDSTSSSSSGKPRLWGTQKQQQSGSRWLLAHGMGKTSSASSKHPLLKSRANAAPAASAAPPAVPGTTSSAPVKNASNKLTESLWSISSRSSTTGSKSSSSSSSSKSSVTRNPDVKLSSRLSFGKKKW